MSVKQGEEAEYGIRAVSEHTGLSAPTIRVWEKRYGAVEPERSGTNRRIYRRSDIERLQLLRKLTEGGHSIGRIAHLENGCLREMADELPVESAIGHDGLGECNKVAVIGRGPGELLEDLELFGAEVVFRADDFGQDPVDLPQADLLIVECENLFLETISKLRTAVERCGAGQTLVIYRFASSKTVTALAGTIGGLGLLKAPVSGIQLRRECLARLNSMRLGREGSGNQGPVPERLYSADQLGRLSRISTAIECECPRHMAELIADLNAFEKYSAECEDRNADDALLHAFLHRTTAHVRRTMEEALRHLVRSEGLKLD